MHREVTPSDTDARVENYKKGDSAEISKHQVYLRSGEHTNLLFLFFPGHGVPVATYSDFLRTAMDAGHHVLGLEYMNRVSLSTRCGEECGDCSESYYAAHREIMFGQNESSVLEVPRPNSILNRLVMLLAWLAQRHPDEGWAQFVVNGQPEWRRVIVAGHSQGSGQAALLAHLLQVARVIMLAGVADGRGPKSNPTTAVQWVTRARETPRDRYFGFVHTGDDRSARVLANWAGMGLTGTPTPADGASPPYGGAHQLVASDQRQNPHGAVAQNTAYQNVWRYLIGGAS